MGVEIYFAEIYLACRIASRIFILSKYSLFYEKQYLFAKILSFLPNYVGTNIEKLGSSGNWNSLDTREETNIKFNFDVMS